MILKLLVIVLTISIAYLLKELQNVRSSLHHSSFQNTPSYTPTIFTSLHYNSVRKILQGDVDQRIFSTKFGPLKNSSNQTATIQQYSVDASHFPPAPFLDVLIFPTSIGEVSQIVALCVRERLPITIQGTLTGLEGAAIPYYGGVVLNMRLMRSVVKLFEQDLQVQVQVGITKSELNTFLEPKGLMFAVDPGSDSSIGGQLSTGASGMLSVLYGTIRENVVQCRVVLPDENGTVIVTKSRAIKSSAGFDLTHLFVGSEGLLGVVVEATLRVVSRPSMVLSSSVVFNTIKNAARTVIEIRSRGLSQQLARCELINSYGMMAVNSYFNRSYQVKPTLFLEFHGSDGMALHVASDMVREIAQKHEGFDYVSTTDHNEQQQVWHARRNIYYAAFKLREGRRGDVKLFVTDVCVPISKLAEIVELSENDIVRFNEEQEKTGNFTLPPIIIGHVADGNFHFNIPYLESNKQELGSILEFNRILIERAVEREGTCSGEHGVGLGKKEGILLEHGPHVIEVMRAIKRAIDRHGVLNRGKVFDYCD